MAIYGKRKTENEGVFRVISILYIWMVLFLSDHPSNHLFFGSLDFAYFVFYARQ